MIIVCLTFFLIFTSVNHFKTVNLEVLIILDDFEKA